MRLICRKRKEKAYVAVKRIDWGDVGDFVAETYLGFVYWSMLTSLGVSIWYFPLWHMGISGFEAVLFVTLSPFFLGIVSDTSTCRNSNAVFSSCISSCGCSLSHSRSDVNRLLTVGLGLAISNLAWTGQLHYAASTNPARFQRYVVAFHWD